MRKLYILFIIMALTVTAFSQNTTEDKKTTDTKTGDKKTDNTTTGDTGKKTEDKVKDDTKPADKKDETKKEEGKDAGAVKLPVGYGDLTWGMYLSDAKGKIAGKLTYTDDKKIIVAREGELEYKYGFFYIDPTVVEDEMAAGDKTGKTEDKTEDKTTPDTGDKTGDKTAADDTAKKKDEGILFYVSLSFPYIDMETVYNKIKSKYGTHSSENLKDNKGSIAWVSEDTIVIMWVDNYRKKPFCRRITYISRKIAKDLNEYTAKLFNKTEREILKSLNP